MLEVFGPSGEAQTLGLAVPNRAFYQLNYTRIFSFCYYTMLRAKIKDFPVCGHSCGQGRILARFGDPAKSRKRPCCKAFRASAVSDVDGTSNAPKPGALPTASYPAIESFSIGNLIILDNVFILHFFAIKSRAYSVPRSYVQHPNDRLHSNSRTQKDAAAWSWWRDSNT